MFPPEGGCPLPPCGGGLGRGVALRSPSLVVRATRERPVRRPTPTLPQKSLRPGARKRGPGGEGAAGLGVTKRVD